MTSQPATRPQTAENPASVSKRGFQVIEGQQSPSRLQLLGALALISVVQGSTFVAVKLAIPVFPPLLQTGLRCLIAGVILLPLFVSREIDKFTTHSVFKIGGYGVVMAMCIAGIAFSQRSLSPNLVAVIASTIPIISLVIDAVMGRWPSVRQVAGSVVGVLGVYLLFRATKFAGAPIDVVILVTSGVLWTIVSAWAKKNAIPSTPFSIGIQGFFGGAVLLLTAVLAGQGRAPVVTWSAVGALGFLVFHSYLFYALLLYLLHRSTVTFAMTFFCISPLVTILGSLLFIGEVPTLEQLGITVIILSSVYLSLPRSAAKVATK